MDLPGPEETVRDATHDVYQMAGRIRTALERLCRSAGHTGRSFESVEEFLAAKVDDYNACVLTDIHLCGASGLTLPERLRELSRKIPVIFITAYDSP